MAGGAPIARNFDRPEHVPRVRRRASVAKVPPVTSARTGGVGDSGGGVVFLFLLTPGGTGHDNTLGAVRGDLAGEGYGTDAILVYRRGGDTVLA